MTEDTLNGLARKLVDAKLLSPSQAMQAHEKANAEHSSFISYLIGQNTIPSQALSRICAEQFGTAWLDLSAFDTNYLPGDLLDEKLITKYKALPLFLRNKRLFIAVSDPMNVQAVDALRFNTGLNVDYILVEHTKLLNAIDSLLDKRYSSALDDVAEGTTKTNQKIGGMEEEEPEDTPIVRFVNKMLLTAIRKGSSDLHFEPYEKAYRVRFRTDGVLHAVASPPLEFASRLASRLKIMSGMDIAERRVPQDGRIKMVISKTQAIDFRVNTLPTLWGEKIVLRILDPGSAQMGIDALGYSDEQKTLYMDALHKPQGMILVTGPTGSGKTVSLYTGLNILNTEERNISTAEDPVEINLEGINQVNVRPKQGMDFSSALRAFLRQDPDVIMVGEIRDIDTANIAIKAAQTGHLVLSTLHTNSAAETLNRLINMGVPAFNLATSINLIIAQRLARRLCPHCKQPQNLLKSTLVGNGLTEAQAETATLYAPKGCEHCQAGYKGRVGIYEVVHITPKLADIIMREGNAIEIAKVSQEEGFGNLRQAGLVKVLQGLTSLEEVNRVTLD